MIVNIMSLYLLRMICDLYDVCRLFVGFASMLAGGGQSDTYVIDM